MRMGQISFALTGANIDINSKETIMNENGIECFAPQPLTDPRA